MTTPVPARRRRRGASPIGESFLPSVIRTAVPIVYAMLVHKGVVEWLDPDDIFITNLITLLVTAAFYAGLRFLEQHKAALGWLLGYARQPIYVKGEVLNVVEHSTPPTTVTEVETDADPPEAR